MAKYDHPTYDNNPFNIGLNGLKLLFRNAKSVVIYAVVVTVVLFIVNTAMNIADFIHAINTTEQQQKARGAADAAAVREFFAQDMSQISDRKRHLRICRVHSNANRTVAVRRA